MRLHLALLTLAAIAAPALAQRGTPSCAAPADLPRPMLEGPTREEPRRLVPIGGYTLALSWSPQYCWTRMTSPKDRLQCSGEMRRFGFVLHGLWPDGKGRDHPQYCAATRLVPDSVIRANLCVSPSVQLIQHEWEKHGTCMSRSAEQYFQKSAPMFRALAFPDMDALRGRRLTAGAFQAAFAAANAGMRADQIGLDVDRQGWLEEVRICLDTGFKRRSCPVGSAVRPGSPIRIR
jgi:ribonuclease T2